jgi:hypothetical protein
MPVPTTNCCMHLTSDIRISPCRRDWLPADRSRIMNHRRRPNPRSWPSRPGAGAGARSRARTHARANDNQPGPGPCLPPRSHRTIRISWAVGSSRKATRSRVVVLRTGQCTGAAAAGTRTRSQQSVQLARRFTYGFFNFHARRAAGRDVRSAPPAKKLRRHLLLSPSSVQFAFASLSLLSSSGHWPVVERRRHGSCARAARMWREPSLAVARPRRLAIRRVAGHRRQPRTARASRGPGVRRNAGACPFQLPPRADDTAACTWNVATSHWHVRHPGPAALVCLVLPYGLAVLWHTRICAASLLLEYRPGKKLELDELARARSSSARTESQLGLARCNSRVDS